MDENAIQQHVVQMLQSHGRRDIVWFAVPNGEARNSAVGLKLKRQGVRAGAADLVFLIDGTFHAVELKVENRGPQPNQIAFRLDVERAGGFYHLCQGLEAAVACLRDIGAFPPGITFSFPIAAAGVRGVRNQPRSPRGGVGSTTSILVREPACRRRPSRI
jgi:hypothetical protein